MKISWYLEGGTFILNPRLIVTISKFGVVEGKGGVRDDSIYSIVLLSKIPEISKFLVDTRCRIIFTLTK